MRISYFNKYIIESCTDTHLNYLLIYKKANGDSGWIRSTIQFWNRGEPESWVDHIMKFQTDYVRNNLLRLEVSIPNRDAYGHIVPGYIKDTVFLIGELEA